MRRSRGQLAAEGPGRGPEYEEIETEMEEDEGKELCQGRERRHEGRPRRGLWLESLTPWLILTCMIGVTLVL